MTSFFLRSGRGRTLAVIALLVPALSFAQAPAASPAKAPPSGPKPNWYNLDLATDSTFGISTEKAYTKLLKGKKVTPVKVAVIDNGVDVAHEDLQGVIWTNPGEVAGNNIDDDHDGFADDVHGWNFIGSSKGNVEFDNLELTRLIRMMRPKYGSITDTTKLSAAERDSLAMYRRMMEDYDQQMAEAQQAMSGIQGFEGILNAIVTAIGKPNPTVADFKAYQPQTPPEAQVTRMLIGALTQEPSFEKFKTDQIGEAKKHFQTMIDYNLNFAFDPRPLVGDDTTNHREHNYGNTDVKGPDGDHGTHVAGIIGAVRTNTIGIQGVADAVLIIPVRAVPEGDERDKDIANAIRYAVDQGARVINMSFGKGYSYDKKVVDEAVQYAMQHDVLMTHAAGNDGKNLDNSVAFPNRKYADGNGTAGAWMEVGASGWRDDESLVAPFSNYGKTTVDVFAPGVRIKSTTPGSTYGVHDGTSMAAPVVTGLAALIRSRYPKLTAQQVKDIIMQSVVKVNHEVVVRDGSTPKRVPFSDVCVSGGVVNAYNALQLAATYK